jgi:Ni/Co efflux regulator RcnB
MRIAILAAVAGLGLGCFGVSGVWAAPLSGTAIKDAAAASRITVVEDRRDRDRDHRDRDRDHARDRDHDRRHCHWSHGHRHCD